LLHYRDGANLRFVGAIRAPESAFAFSRTIRVMPHQRGSTMALQGFFGFPRAPARPADDTDEAQSAYLAADWGERVVTAVAVAVALTVVALIAVLMGSVGP
jgi:hypothetical protein